jgi:hypothetical protein
MEQDKEGRGGGGEVHAQTKAQTMGGRRFETALELIHAESIGALNHDAVPGDDEGEARDAWLNAQEQPGGQAGGESRGAGGDGGEGGLCAREEEEDEEEEEEEEKEEEVESLSGGKEGDVGGLGAQGEGGEGEGADWVSFDTERIVADVMQRATELFERMPSAETNEMKSALHVEGSVGDVRSGLRGVGEEMIGGKEKKGRSHRRVILHHPSLQKEASPRCTGGGRDVPAPSDAGGSGGVGTGWNDSQGSGIKVDLLEALARLDGTTGLPFFLREAGIWAHKMLNCQAAHVMLVSMGADGVLVIASEAVDHAKGRGTMAAANGYRLVTVAAEGLEESGGVGEALAVVAARGRRCRRLHGLALKEGMKRGEGAGWGRQERKGPQLLPEIDLLGLQGGGEGVDGLLTSVMCAPWELEVDAFFRVPEGVVGERKGRRDRKMHESPMAQGLAPERLALVVVGVNKCRGQHGQRGGGGSAGPKGGERGGAVEAPSFSEEDERAALQCARLLATRCQEQAKLARKQTMAELDAAVAGAALDIHAAPGPFDASQRATKSCLTMLINCGHLSSDISVRFLSRAPAAAASSFFKNDGGGERDGSSSPSLGSTGGKLLWQPSAGGVAAEVSESSTAAQAMRHKTVVMLQGKAAAAEIGALLHPVDLTPLRRPPAASAADTRVNEPSTLSATTEEGGVGRGGGWGKGGVVVGRGELGGCLLCVPAATWSGEVLGVLQLVVARAGARMDEKEVRYASALARHLGEALGNIALREQPVRSVLLNVMHRDYASCVAAIALQVKAILGCGHVEVLPNIATPTGLRPVPFRLPSTNHNLAQPSSKLHGGGGAKNINVSLFGSDASVLGASRPAMSLGGEAGEGTVGFVDRSLRADARRGLCDLVAAQRVALVYRDLEAVQRVVVPPLDLINSPALAPRNCIAVPCLSLQGALEGVVIAYNGKRSGGFAKRDEVSLLAMGREFAAAMNLCQEEAKHEASISLRNAQIDKWQQDVAFLAKMTRKLQLALDLKDSFIVAHRQLRKLCQATTSKKSG